MFNADFWPTPPEVTARMIEALDNVKGKKILEPSAGMGNLVISLKQAGAEVIACEKDERLRRVLEHECTVIASDFFSVTSADISHIHAIVMNPPFFYATQHIKHAWDIAPDGCMIVALCNTETLKNNYSSSREHLTILVKDYGYAEELGDCFSEAERKTEVQVSMIFLRKPCVDQEQEFAGFFMDEEPEGFQEDGIMPYDAIRDIVNRYVAAVKLYEHQIEMGDKMRALTDIFPTHYDSRGQQEHLHYLTCNKREAEKYRAEFKKGLQKRAWKFIFDKLDMQKHSTRGLKEDINKFVEHQVNIPFTMKNIYRMLEIVVGTTGSRMDKALLEVFDRVTKYTEDNRYGVEGWKTNSNYLLNKRFIINYMCGPGWGGGIDFKFHNNGEVMEDFAKALCHMTASRYEDMYTLAQRIRGKAYRDGSHKELDIELPKVVWGQWFEWGFFRARCYKKGTMHFEFLDNRVWENFNAHIARIKGYPLPESHKRRKEYKNTYDKAGQEAA